MRCRLHLPVQQFKQASSSRSNCVVVEYVVVAAVVALCDLRRLVGSPQLCIRMGTVCASGWAACYPTLWSMESRKVTL